MISGVGRSFAVNIQGFLTEPREVLGTGRAEPSSRGCGEDGSPAQGPRPTSPGHPELGAGREWALP